MGRCGGKTSNENENEVTATHGWEHCLGYRRRVGVSRRVVSRHGDEAGRRSRSGTRSMIPVKVGSVVYPGDGVIHVSLSLFLFLSLSLSLSVRRQVAAGWDRSGAFFTIAMATYHYILGRRGTEPVFCSAPFAENSNCLPNFPSGGISWSCLYGFLRPKYIFRERIQRLSTSSYDARTTCSCPSRDTSPRGASIATLPTTPPHTPSPSPSPSPSPPTLPFPVFLYHSRKSSCSSGPCATTKCSSSRWTRALVPRVCVPTVRASFRRKPPRCNWSRRCRRTAACTWSRWARFYWGGYTMEGHNRPWPRYSSPVK